MTMNEKGQIIRVENLTIQYKEKDILKRLKYGKRKRGVENISFHVNEGEVFSIIGLNGAGKTSTMKSILGLISPNSGSVKVFGKNKLETKDFERIGYLPEISYYPKSMKLNDLMMYYCSLYNMDRSTSKVKIKEVLSELGIYDRLYDRLEGFSKGMLQKVGLAQAIINNPKVLFLDEPMSGLDPLARKKVIDLINDMKAKGTTIFFNTHILTDVADIGDRIAIIHEGRLIDILDIKNLKENDRYIFNVENSSGKYQSYSLKKSQLHEKLSEILENGDKILEIKREEFSLKDYFIGKIGGSEDA